MSKNRPPEDLSFIELDVDKRGVARVTMNRPDIHNGFNDAAISDLTRTFQYLSNAENVRVVVLQGAGRSFSAGADLEWMRSMAQYDEETNRQDSLRLAQMFETINNCRKPVIAKVQGAAIGGGMGLVATADYVVAGQDHAKFGLSEVRLGIAPAAISPFVMAKIGETHMRALGLSGIRFNAERARQIGLVHEVVPNKDLDARTEELVGEFLNCAPGAVAETKTLISDVGHLSQKEPGPERSALMKHTSGVIAKLRVAPEGQAGTTAFLAKEKPPWVPEPD